MATMAASNVRDVGSKDMQAHNNSSTRIDLANIADVPYYVESNSKSIIFSFNIFIKYYLYRTLCSCR
jgi:hypothetical protein